MKFSVYVPNFGEFADPRRMAELAQEAEQAGWDGFFIWDHMLMFPGNVVGDPWIQLAAVASATSRITLGPMVTPLSRRRPWVVARQAVSLDQLSEGRMVLGVGLGFPASAEFDTFGEPADAKTRAEILDEALDIITGLWTGEEYVHDGHHFTLEPVTFLPTAVQQPRIPIWVAATWPHKRPFRRAARYDGVFPLKSTATDLDDMTPQDWAEMTAYLTEHQPTSNPLVMSGFFSGNYKDELAVLQNAGVDWAHMAPPTGIGFDDFKSQIRRGPPK